MNHPIPRSTTSGTAVIATVPPPEPLRAVPLRAAIARRILSRAVARLPLIVALPGGERLGAGAASDPVLTVARPRAFFARLGADAKIGFGEAYQAGDWQPGADTDLADLLTVFAANIADVVPPALQHLRPLVDRRQPAAERNTTRGARANIHRHYDLPPQLFEAFLDETMSYSSAMFNDGETLPSEGDIAAAQRRKIDSALDLAGVGPGTELLEIGTGWGELAIRAAQRGANVTSLTLSAEQHDLATRRIVQAGVADRASVVLADYRNARGSYDAIVSVEMIEAVGESYWPVFFKALDRLLRPGGRIALQSILMPHDRMMATRHSYSWIHKYVFPGGIIPSRRAIDVALARNTSLAVESHLEFGADYATTLRWWRHRFLQRWPDLETAGFDPRFQRTWEFYLAYSEAGFRAGYLDVTQLAITRPA